MRCSRVQINVFRDQIAFFCRLNGIKQSLGIPGATQEICSLLKRFVIVERQHHDCLVSVAGDDHGIPIEAYTIHCGGKVLTGGGIGDCSHMDRIMHMFPGDVNLLFFRRSSSGIPACFWRRGSQAASVTEVPKKQGLAAPARSACSCFYRASSLNVDFFLLFRRKGQNRISLSIES